MEEKIFQMDFAGRPLTVEVGKLAKQSSANRPNRRPCLPVLLTVLFGPCSRKHIVMTYMSWPMTLQSTTITLRKLRL